MKRYSKANDVFFYILIRSWNGFTYLNRCIDSVLNQSYKNYKILFVDDHSGYDTKKRTYIKNKLKGHLVKFNRKRLYSLRNAYNLLTPCPNRKNTVVFNLDGDDWLLNHNSLAVVADIYRQNKNCLLTYGECLLWTEKGLGNKPSRLSLPNANRHYSQKIIGENNYRQEPFLPLHPRTWKLSLFKKIMKSDFLRPDGTWLRFAEDQAIFYPLLEMAGGNFETIKKPIYVHRFEHQNSDLKANLVGLVKDELIIRRKPKYEALF